MPNTLLELKEEANSRLAEGKTLDALKVFRLVLEGAPLDFELRLEIGDVIAALGANEFALAIFNAVAEHDTKSGNPLRAIAALKRIEMLGGDITSIVDLLALKYALGSSTIGRGIKPAPADYSAPIREGIDLDYAIDTKKLILETSQMAAYIDNIKNYPAVVPPLPIFSTMETKAFVELLQKLKLRQYKKGDAIVKQGDAGQAVFFVARGDVIVVRSTKQPDGEDREVRLARLGAGSLLGEMALVSADPRSASVISTCAVDALELTRDKVDELSEQMPQVKGAMTRFTRERMIANLLSTNPMFKVFDGESKKQLLARFTGHEVPAGTIFLEQGSVGNGLYVILQGRAEVLKYDNDEYIKLSDLGPGDVAGEISVLFAEPVSATVRTTTPATLLFLARELFEPLVDAFPELMSHFNRLAESRLDDTEFKLMQKEVVDEDFVEEFEEEELSDDDIVFI